MLEGAFSQVTYSLITTTIVSSYLAILSAPATLVGLILAIPNLTTVMQIIFANYVERNSRRKVAVFASSLAKLSIIVMGLSTFIDAPSAVVIFALSYLVFNIFEDVLTVSWSSWTQDMLHKGKRGELLSKRLSFGKLVALPILAIQTILFHLLGDRAFSLLFFVAFLFGIASVYFLNSMSDVKSNRIGEGSLLEPLKNRNFVIWVLLNSIFWFSLGASRGFFALFVLNVLNCSLWFLIYLTLVAHASSIYSLKIAGKISDYFGNKPLFAIIIITFLLSIIMFAISPLVFPALTLTLAYALHGFYTSAPTISFMNAVADMAYKKHSSQFYAIGNWIVDLSSAMGCIIGGIVLYATSNLGIGSYFILFSLSFAVSLLAIVLLKFYFEFAQPVLASIFSVPKIVYEDFQIRRINFRKTTRTTVKSD